MVENKLIPGKLYVVHVPPHKLTVNGTPFTGVRDMGYPIEGGGPYLSEDGVGIDQESPVLYIGEHLDPARSMWNSMVLVGDRILVVRGKHMRAFEETK